MPLLTQKYAPRASVDMGILTTLKSKIYSTHTHPRQPKNKMSLKIKIKFPPETKLFTLDNIEIYPNIDIN